MNPLRPIGRIYREAFAGLPREIWMLSLAALVNRAGTMVLPFFVLFLTLDRGLTVIAAGRLVGVYGLGSLAGSYLGGTLSDRVGAVRTQQASLILAGVGYFIILRFHEPLALGIAVFATSLAAEAFRPAVMTSIAHRAPAGLESRCFALLRLAVNLGMAVGPAVGGLLATVSYRLLFVGDAVTSWGAALLLFLLLPAARRGRDEIAAADGAARLSPWRDGPFLLLTGVVGLLACCFFQVFSTLPLYLRESFGLRENAIGLVLALNAVLIVLFEMVLIHWAEGRDKLRMIGAGCFLICLGLGLLPLGRGIGWAAATTVVWTAGEMLTLPLVNAAVADRSSAGARGSYMGIYTMAFSAAFIVAPVYGTWVYERFGPTVLWLGIGLAGVPLGIGAAALSDAFRRPRAPRRPA